MASNRDANMLDDKYAISLPAAEDASQPAIHRTDRRRANAAIVVSVASALFTLAAAIFTFWQAWEAREARLDARAAAEAQQKEVEYARKISDENLRQATKLAEANSVIARTQADSLALARQNDEESRSHFHDQLRPFLTAAEPKVELKSIPPPHGFQHFPEFQELRFIVRNEGKSPAINISYSCTTNPYSVFGGPVDMPKLRPHNDWIKNTPAIAPSDSDTFSTYLPNDANKSSNFWRISCVVDYADIYDISRKQPHEFKFCYEIQLPPEGKVTAIYSTQPCGMRYR